MEMLVHLLEAGSYVAAGERLHVAHSAVHRQIRLLEEELGQRLVYRDGGAIHPTAAGKDVVEVARRVLKDISNLSHRLAGEKALRTGHILLGTGTTMFLYFLPKVLSIFREQFPLVNVQILTGSATEILAGIRESTIDLGIVFSDVPDEPATGGVQFEPLYTEEFVLIVPPGHPLESVRAPGVAQLNGIPLISLSRTSRIRHMIETRLEAARVSMRVVMELENEEAIEKMVGIGVGTGFISRRRAEVGGLRYLRLKDLKLLAYTCAAYSTRIPIGPAAQAFLAMCLEQARLPMPQAAPALRSTKPARTRTRPAAR
ncbi:LysR family transcriptional regulator [Paludibaculum fermentans]|uniref:LysR family transcriptional regulator n=1 Tax=Paludibaculum fermentans TaxID=1473598 RepID=A0A7S7NUT8_PALFE|nr:LysR family transcriptional regulator [Paludibaculum fermentans]QOY90150.1 LysR family transcriptional regulator [Paludibaculum fermentans]